MDSAGLDGAEPSRSIPPGLKIELNGLFQTPVSHTKILAGLIGSATGDASKLLYITVHRDQSIESFARII